MSSTEIKKITHIQGPVTFRLLTNDEKKIYLFGDMHVKTGIECPNYESIIEVLDNVTNKYNFYVEAAPEHAEEEIELSNYLREVIKKIRSNSIRSVKYTDTRHIYFDYILHGVMAMYDNLGFLGEGLSKGTLSDILINSLLNKIVGAYNILLKNMEQTEQVINNVMFGINKMNLNEKIKSLRISNPVLSSKILNFLQTQRDNILSLTFISNYSNSLSYFGDMIDELKITGRVPSNFFQSVKVNYSLLLEISGEIAELTGLYMDIYLLYQLLTDDVENNVIYAGELHCKKYTEFLTEIGYKIKFEYGDISQCLPIKDAKLPLFSE